MNGGKPKVSIYLPSHNYGRFLEQSVESVLRQSMDSWELLLVDDGSSDNTLEVFRMYRGDSRIRVFETGGIGLPAVANMALKNAVGEYIIRLDGDDVFDENILLVLSNHLDRRPDTALVFPDYFQIDEVGNIFSHERREQLHFANHSLDMPAHGACTMVRREILEKLGGYREDLGAQDGFDLWSRIVREHKCENVNVPLFYYRRHGKNLTENSGRILHARRTIKKDNCREDIAKHGPITALIPCRRLYDFKEDLWNQRLNGITLLDRAIVNCLGSDLFDHVVVASDNPEVRKTMANYGDPRLRFFERKTEETFRSRPVTLTMDKMYKELGFGWDGLTVLSYLQAPFTTTEIMEEAIHTLVLNGADSSFAVNQLDRPVFRRSEHGLEPVITKKGFNSDFDALYIESGISLATRNANLRTGSLTGKKIVNFQVSQDESFFIHTERDLEIARIMYRQIKNREQIKKAA